MLSEAVERIIRGDLVAWALVGAVWLVTAIAIFAHRSDAPPSLRRVLTVLLAALATSAGGFIVAAAVAVPRLHWRTEISADLVAPQGETWRHLRGPSAQVLTSDGPDIAVPTLDAEDRWVLYGLLSGQPIEGLPPAADVAPLPGAPRICHTTSERCRAWPSTWPDPTQAPRYSELHWERTGALSAAAYDVESRLYLTSATLAPQEPRVGAEALEDATALELVGRLSNDPSRDTLSSLFIVRRVVGGRLRAMRLVSAPAAFGSYTFVLQRADVALTAGPRMLRFAARPVLLAAALCLPLAVIAYMLAPAWLAALLRRRAAVFRELASPLTLARITQTSVLPGVASLAAVTEEAHLGDALLSRGEVVALALDGGGGESVVSRAWFELPDETPRGEAEAGARRRVGALIPADREPFRRAAEAWLSRALHSVAVGVAGLAALAPGLVAVVSLIAGR